MTIKTEKFKQRYKADSEFRERVIKSIRNYQNKSIDYKTYQKKYREENKDKINNKHKLRRDNAKKNGICMLCLKNSVNIITEQGETKFSGWYTCDKCRERTKTYREKKGSKKCIEEVSANIINSSTDVKDSGI